MAIGDEKIIENFTARNMGSSGVASRELQAANLPDLSASLAESVAARAQIERSRISEFQSRVNNSNGSIRVPSGGSKGGAGFDSSRPFAALTFAKNGLTGKGVTAPTFGLSFSSGPGAGGRRTERFGSIEEVQKFIQSNPDFKNIQLVGAGAFEGMDERQLKVLEALGIKRASTGAVSDALKADSRNGMTIFDAARLAGSPGKGKFVQNKQAAASALALAEQQAIQKGAISNAETVKAYAGKGRIHGSLFDKSTLLGKELLGRFV